LRRGDSVTRDFGGHDEAFKQTADQVEFRRSLVRPLTARAGEATLPRPIDFVTPS
jgi:hypothetical protein